MKKHIREIIAGVVVLFIVLSVFILLGSAANSITDVRKQAIELGYAEYNSTNGVWQWKHVSTNK